MAASRGGRTDYHPDNHRDQHENRKKAVQPRQPKQKRTCVNSVSAQRYLRKIRGIADEPSVKLVADPCVVTAARSRGAECHVR